MKTKKGQDTLDALAYALGIKGKNEPQIGGISGGPLGQAASGATTGGLGGFLGNGWAGTAFIPGQAYYYQNAAGTYAPIGDRLQSGSITADKIATGSITADKIDFSAKLMELQQQQKAIDMQNMRPYSGTPDFVSWADEDLQKFIASQGSQKPQRVEGVPFGTVTLKLKKEKTPEEAIAELAPKPRRLILDKKEDPK